MLLLHIGAAHLNHDRPNIHRPQSFWDHLTPHIRLVGVLGMLLAIAFTPNAHWATWMIYGCGILWLLRFSQVDLFKLCERMAVESVFVSVALLGMLFRDGGEVLWHWGWFKITTLGLTIFGSVACKLLLSLLLLNLLTLTIPVPILLQSLSILKVPPLLIAILGSMYRYLDVLVEEFATMGRAATARNLMNGKHWQRLVIGNMIGSLFLRTYDRGNRIHQAMIARGYQGFVPLAVVPKMRGGDRFFLLVTVLLAVLGQLIYYCLRP
jgi:cobalt/nickel transport system permease protein